MLIKHEIKSWKDGSILFSYEKEGNTISETVQKFLNENMGKTISFADFSSINLLDVTFTLSTLYDCKFDKCTFDYCKFDSCKFYKCRVYDCKFYSCKFYDCSFNSCSFNSCSLECCKFYEITITTFSKSLDSIRFDFFGRMLVLKDEVQFLKQSLIDGLIDGSQYEGECCCFIGTAAKSKQVKYDQIEGIKPDSNSNTERWFMGIKKGDTPQNSTIAKITLEWIEEFERLIAK
jgi:hypothetical protein